MSTADRFEWLAKEIASIKTNKFHVVDGPANPELREAVEKSPLMLPPSYKEFVLRFGNTNLYTRDGNWLVKVFAGPRDVSNDKGEVFFNFGRTFTSFAYFKESLLVEGAESPVFEWRYRQGIRKIADSFPLWLEARCAWARRQFKKKEWIAIEQGPPPFTERELLVIEARKRFRWSVIGTASNDDLRFRIHNGSTIVLPYFSLGVRGNLKPPNSGPLGDCSLALPVMSILPGETRIVEHDCYKNVVAPGDAEVYDLPDPGPEDRSLYWEFRELP